MTDGENGMVEEGKEEDNGEVIQKLGMMSIEAVKAQAIRRSMYRDSQ